MPVLKTPLRSFSRLSFSFSRALRSFHRSSCFSLSSTASTVKKQNKNSQRQISWEEWKEKWHIIRVFYIHNYFDGLNFISFGMRSYVLQLLYGWESCPECTTCWPSQWRRPGKKPPARGAFLAAFECSRPVLGSPSGTGISYGTFLPSTWTRWCPAGAGEQIETPCLFICKKNSKRNRI